MEALDALTIGKACCAIGAGRQLMGEALSLGNGVLLHKKVGDTVREGDILFSVLAEIGGSPTVRSVRVLHALPVRARVAAVVSGLGPGVE